MIPSRWLLPACALLLWAAPFAAAQDTEDLGGEVTVKLSTGETLKGVLVAVDGLTVVIQHPVLGELAIPRASILPPDDGPVEPVSPWSGSFDLSVNGSRGNNQRQDTRVGFNARRETESTVDSYALTYNRSTSEVRDDGPPKVKTTEKTADRVFGQARREWLLQSTRWRPFAQISAEVDDFKDWDYRTTVAAGAAHPLLETENQELLGRFGLAATREFGGEDESWTPEALLGADYWLALGKDQRVVAAVEVYPDLEDQGEYRSIARANYEAQFNPEDPWTLKIGVERFYDSDPAPGVGKMDVNYFVGVGYIF